MTADSTGDGEKSFRERVNEEIDEGQIDDDSDKSFGERVNEIQEMRSDGEQSESGSQVSLGSPSLPEGGIIRTAAIMFGRLLVLLVGLYLVGSAIGFW